MFNEHDDLEIPELTDEELKNMKPNPYVEKVTDEQKILDMVVAYLSYGNIDKKKLKEELAAILA